MDHLAVSFIIHAFKSIAPLGVLESSAFVDTVPSTSNDEDQTSDTFKCRMVHKYTGLPTAPLFFHTTSVHPRLASPTDVRHSFPFHSIANIQSPRLSMSILKRRNLLSSFIATWRDAINLLPSNLGREDPWPCRLTLKKLIRFKEKGVGSERSHPLGIKFLLRTNTCVYYLPCIVP